MAEVKVNCRNNAPDDEWAFGDALEPSIAAKALVVFLRNIAEFQSSLDAMGHLTITVDRD